MSNYKNLQNGSDIRGVAIQIEGGKEVNLTRKAAADLSIAFAIWTAKKLNKKVGELIFALGRDSRISGPELAKECLNAISNQGAMVYDCGMASTPAMFMACIFDETNADGSIMLTASHLPMERNGMKFFTKDGGLEEEEIAELISIAEGLSDQKREIKGQVKDLDLMSLYSKHLRNIICQGLNAKEEDKPLSNLHIVVDAGNGAGGFYVSDVLQPLGADCSGSQFLEPDGTFPNHIPNPENKEAMESICQAVKKVNCDFGIIFDTDVDRVSAVGSDGREIARNRIIALAAYLASKNDKGATVVTDSVTSDELAVFLEDKLGLKHFRFKRGYKNVIDKGIALNKEGVNCVLSIETSGHAAMKENYFLDDGAYLATKIVIEAALIKKADGSHIEDLIKGLGEPVEAREVRFKVNTENFADYMQEILDYIETNVEKISGWKLVKPNYEGVRINTDYGWMLARKSLHDPEMPVNLEAKKPGGVDIMLRQFKQLVNKFDKLSE